MAGLHALQRLTESDPKLHYVYCGSAFLTPAEDGINEVGEELGSSNLLA